MKRLVCATVMGLTLFLASCGKPSAEEWLTYYEKSGCLETPRYDETIRYIEKLANHSGAVHLTYFGISPQGRKLPLVIVDKDGAVKPSDVRRKNRCVALIQACIHPGEPDGKDAGLMLIRDMVIHKKHAEPLDRITILFMPIFNADGHERFGPYNRINQNGPKEMGWRVTSQNLNLNRDFMKADAPEMRSWLKVFNEWLPDLYIDCHVTDGADYEYAVTYAIDHSENIEKPLRDWTAGLFLPAWKKQMDSAGFPVFPYVSPRIWSNFTKGLNGGIAPPRLSTGYGAIQNRPSLLIETHMFKDYKTRVDGTYQSILQALDIISREHASLKKAIEESDRRTAEPGSRYIPLAFRQTDKADTVTLKGFTYHLQPSRISGDSVIVWEKTPAVHRLAYYNDNLCTDSAQAPWAYIVPRQWTAVIDVIKAHGIEMKKLKKETEQEVTSTGFRNIAWESRAHEGRVRFHADVMPFAEKRKFFKGDYVIRMNQRLNKVIMHLLEPKAPDSFVRWGFFNAVFEQKEYAENYKMELLAEEMIAADPTLYDEFLKDLKSDSVMAKSPHARYNWFYRRTPYWDNRLNLYPVAKIMKPAVIE